MATFQFVYIPVDRSCALEQWRLKIEKGQEVECLLDRLKEHFIHAHPSASAEQQKRRKQELLKQSGLPTEKISEQLLEAATMQLVESIALLPPMQKHGHVGVTMYMDDSGTFKQLPVNERATDIAASCGMISTSVVGDAFIGRVKENDDEFERMDFLVSEVSSNAQWMKDARTHHQQKLLQPTAQEVLKNLKRKPEITEITPAEELRQKGNKAYREGDYAEAIKSYSVCLEHDGASALAYSNRAMAHLQLKNFEAGLSDAEAALKLDASSVKARYRRGLALEGLERREDAITEFKEILKQQPGNKAAAQKLETLQTETQS